VPWLLAEVDEEGEIGRLVALAAVIPVLGHPQGVLDVGPVEVVAATVSVIVSGLQS
jgi:hypothetical protein